MTDRPRTILVASSLLGLAACTEVIPPIPQDRDAAVFSGDANAPAADASSDATADATVDGSMDANIDGGRCSDTLENVNTGFGPLCPGTFTAALAALSCSTATFPPATFAGACGGLSAVAISFTTHWKLCVYDGVDAGSLVGAAGENDVDSFCDQTASTIVGGQVPDACMSSPEYFSALLSPVDASCPPADAAAEGGPDASTD
jgi:hypothetical protein